MKRSWNAIVWIGFILALFGAISYPLIFARFPLLRDVPWASLAILAIALILLGVGITRAFRRPDAYRGKIFGSILGVLAVALTVIFCYGVFYSARQIPESHGSPQVGQFAPDFTLPDSRNVPVNLSGTLHSTFVPTGSLNIIGIPPFTFPPPAATVLIFYRGYW